MITNFERERDLTMEVKNHMLMGRFYEELAKIFLQVLAFPVMGITHFNMKVKKSEHICNTVMMKPLEFMESHLNVSFDKNR